MKSLLTAFAAIACLSPLAAQEPDQLCPEGETCVLNLAGKNRVFWMTGKGLKGDERYWRVLDGAAFREHGNGSATMTAAIINLVHPSMRFSVDIDFYDHYPAHHTPPEGSPKIEDSIVPLLEENGGPVDPDTWRYYAEFTGTLTGQLALEGAVLRVTRRGPAFQIGFGANVKDASYGASGWFDIDVLSQPTHGEMPAFDVGDINGSFGECECLGGDEAFWQNYGEGLAGCDGVPSLEMLKQPLTGTVPEIAIGGGSVTRSCAMVWGIAPAETFIPFLGGNLLIQTPVAAAIPFTLSPTGFVFECAIPEDPCGVGNDVYLQIICIDDCGPTGFSMSRGLQIHVGDL